MRSITVMPIINRSCHPSKLNPDFDERTAKIPREISRASTIQEYTLIVKKRTLFRYFTLLFNIFFIFHLNDTARKLTRHIFFVTINIVDKVQKDYSSLLLEVHLLDGFVQSYPI